MNPYTIAIAASVALLAVVGLIAAGAPLFPAMLIGGVVVVGGAVAMIKS